MPASHDVDNALPILHQTSVLANSDCLPSECLEAPSRCTISPRLRIGINGPANDLELLTTETTLPQPEPVDSSYLYRALKPTIKRRLSGRSTSLWTLITPLASVNCIARSSIHRLVQRSDL